MGLPLRLPTPPSQLPAPPPRAADVMHLATLAERNDALLQCVRRLERCTQTFQARGPGAGPLQKAGGMLSAPVRQPSS